MAGRTTTISIRIRTVLLEEIGKVTANRNEFVIGAIEARLKEALGEGFRDGAMKPTLSMKLMDFNKGGGKGSQTALGATKAADARGNPSLDVSSNGVAFPADSGGVGVLDGESGYAGEYTPKEQRRIVQAGKRLADIMNDLLIAEAGKRRNFLEDMTNEDLAKLVVSRLPKEASSNEELEADVLSLKGSIAALPGIEDLTNELRRVKGVVVKLETEAALAKRECKMLRAQMAKLEGKEGYENAGSWESMLREMYERMVEYVVDLAARNSLPGIGDGGGLSEAGYAELGRKVKSEIGKLGIVS